MHRYLLVPTLLAVVGSPWLGNHLVAEETATEPPVIHEHPVASDERANEISPQPGTGVLVITPLRRESDEQRAPLRVDVIGAEDIQRRGYASRLRDQLDNRSGVLLRSNGGYGGATSISLRGTASGDTRILQDGLPVIDSTEINSTMDFSRIPGAGMQSMEVLFGAQSGLYGSSAVGGVINISTARPSEFQENQVLVEAGSLDTYRAQGVFTGPISKEWGYAISVHGLQSAGISNRYDNSDPQTALGNSGSHEKDGFEQYGGRARLEWSPHIDGQLYVAAEQNYGIGEFDSFMNPDDDKPEQRLNDLRLSMGGQWQLSNDLQLFADVLYSDNRRTYKHETLPERRYFNGDLWYGQVRASYAYDEMVTIDGGLDAERQSMDQQPGSVSIRNIGLWSTLSVEEEHYVLALTARHDQHQREGSATTFRAAAAWFFWEKRLKLHASVGSAFKAPSLYQLYSPADFGSGPIGNSSLKAERSVGYELGVSVRPQPWLLLESTWYRTSYREKIDFSTGYINTGSDSEITGYDVRVSVQPADEPWRLSAYYNQQRATAVARVPERLLGGEATYEWSHTWLTLGARHVGQQDNAVDPYTVVYAAAGWRPRPSIELYVRAENLNDEDYVEQPGFTTLRPAAWVGMKADF